MPDTDDDDIIIIRGGRVTVRRADVTTEEAGVLDEIAAKGDSPLTKLEAYTLGVILQRLTIRP
ncbi:MAG: hypothetical protein ACRCTG_13875 [Aestuariivirga sp.]